MTLTTKHIFMHTSTDFIQFNIQYASIALVYYDYMLTFSWEIKYVWGERFRPSTFFYICTRYSLFVNILFLVAIIDKTSPQVCDVGYKICCVFSVLGRAAVILVWTARTYAVFSKNRFILIYFSGLGLACIALDIAHVPSVACQGSSNLVSTLLAGLMCVFEISAALCTSIRTIQALLLNDPALTPKGGMVFLLLEQGIAYFCAVTCLAVGAFILSLRAPGGFFQRLLNALTLPISCLMTARFLLHLRRWENKHTTSDDDTIESIRFGGNAVTSQSLLSDFGEDPVRRAERDIQIGRIVSRKARALDPDNAPENDNSGEGSSSMV